MSNKQHCMLVRNAMQSNNAVALLRAFHAKGIDISDCTGYDTIRQSMILAAAMGRLDVLKLLPELLGARVVNATDENGASPIIVAAHFNQAGAIRALCAAGGDPRPRRFCRRWFPPPQSQR